MRYPDKELLGHLVGEGVPSKNSPKEGTLFLGTNHAGALTYHDFVHKAYMYIWDCVDDLGIVRFRVSACPQ